MLDIKKFYFVLFSFLFGCNVFVGDLPNPNKLSDKVIENINYGIYEIVVPKIETDNIIYERELPFDKLGFIERNDKFQWRRV